jgi:hypothetical protein
MTRISGLELTSATVGQINDLDVRYIWLIDNYRIQREIVPLSTVNIDFVKAKDRELERGPESTWACTHCPACLTRSIQYTDVVKHVRQTCVIFLIYW